jgi:ferric-dicitrate binding protein FerR (iron transport regulator)
MGGSPPAPAAGEPSRVAAGASPSTLSYGDAFVTLQAHSAVLMDPNTGRPTALLEDGAAVFAVAPRGERAPFVVLAGDLSARTSSATFTVTRHGERADVAVDAGTVDVRYRGHDARVAAGQAWSSEHPDAVLDVRESTRR